LENEGILYVFLVFQTAGLAEKIRRPRSGIYSEVPLERKSIMTAEQKKLIPDLRQQLHQCPEVSG